MTVTKRHQQNNKTAPTCETVGEEFSYLCQTQLSFSRLLQGVEVSMPWDSESLHINNMCVMCVSAVVIFISPASIGQQH